MIYSKSTKNHSPLISLTNSLTRCIFSGERSISSLTRFISSFITQSFSGLLSRLLLPAGSCIFNNSLGVQFRYVQNLYNSAKRMFCTLPFMISLALARVTPIFNSWLNGRLTAFCSSISFI